MHSLAKVGRRCCFRALPENPPRAFFDGVFSPSPSKPTVRCMINVIEVLCSSENAPCTLRNPPRDTALRRTCEVMEVMIRSISIISQMTSGWPLFLDAKGIATLKPGGMPRLGWSEDGGRPEGGTGRDGNSWWAKSYSTNISHCWRPYRVVSSTPGHPREPSGNSRRLSTRR